MIEQRRKNQQFFWAHMVDFRRLGHIFHGFHRNTEIPSSIFSPHLTMKSETSINYSMLFVLPAAQALA